MPRPNRPGQGNSKGGRGKIDLGMVLGGMSAASAASGAAKAGSGAIDAVQPSVGYGETQPTDDAGSITPPRNQTYGGADPEFTRVPAGKKPGFLANLATRGTAGNQYAQQVYDSMADQNSMQNQWRLQSGLNTQQEGISQRGNTQQAELKAKQAIADMLLRQGIDPRNLEQYNTATANEIIAAAAAKAKMDRTQSELGTTKFGQEQEVLATPEGRAAHMTGLERGYSLPGEVQDLNRGKQALDVDEFLWRTETQFPQQMGAENERNRLTAEGQKETSGYHDWLMKQPREGSPGSWLIPSGMASNLTEPLKIPFNPRVGGSMADLKAYGEGSTTATPNEAGLEKIVLPSGQVRYLPRRRTIQPNQGY